MPLTPGQEDRLSDILEGSWESELLTPWERQFIDGLTAQYEEKGVDTIVTPKMWVVLEEISDKTQT